MISRLLGTILHWFRRDLRLRDNTALAAAARDADLVVPVFVLDDHYRAGAAVGPSRFRFLRESLEDLDEGLRAIGSRLLVRPGPPAEALARLAAETGAEIVYANEEIGPYPRQRDRDAARALEAAGARLRLFFDELAVDPRSIRTAAGRPYTVFTPFYRRWREAERAEPAPPPARLDTPPLEGVALGRVAAWKDLPENPRAPRGGEREARRRLAAFLEGRIRDYAARRDRPAEDATSRLSAALHFGTVSERAVLAGCRESARGAPERSLEGIDAFVRQIAWRDFSHSLLLEFPRIAREAFRPELDALEWDEPGNRFEAWKDGRTGYPFVDAAMRQLRAENWMHNRARMIVASFLTKDLHVDWRHGQRWFELQLADADLANNSAGWQWAAGTGADAAPYFRVFNPVSQSRKFDPEGAYIRRWLPKVRNRSGGDVHEPRDPIVDHAAERAEALARYRRALDRGRNLEK
jgi:deoxyribodipyrimidine photo-lyase